jgi:predicted transcriptional regulator
MGRRALSGTKRTTVITFKADPDWVAALDERARQVHLSRSELIRRAVSGVKIVEPPGSSYKNLVVQLIKLGTLYNQTVHLAHRTSHQTGTIPTTALLEQLESNQATLDAMLKVVLSQDPRQRAPSA